MSLIILDENTGHSGCPKGACLEVVTAAMGSTPCTSGCARAGPALFALYARLARFFLQIRQLLLGCLQRLLLRIHLFLLFPHVFCKLCLVPKLSACITVKSSGSQFGFPLADIQLPLQACNLLLLRFQLALDLVAF